MAPTDSNSIYFPSLESCLHGEHQLLSWSAALNALASPNNAQHEWILQRFLTDASCVKQLETPLDPFAPPSPESKSLFETLTAAINITPSQHTPFDIDQLKGDALWLSNKTKIDEPSALRIAVLEWQNRPASQLLRGLSDPRNDALGKPDFGSSILLSRTTADYGLADAATFASKTNVRSRLLRLYLSERTSILRIAEIMVRAYQCDDNVFGRHKEVSVGAKGTEKGGGKDWVPGLGQIIRDNMGTPKRSFVAKCQTAIESRLENVEKGSEYDEQEAQFDIEEDFIAQKLTEIIHILQMMSTRLEDPEPLDATNVKRWFELMARCQFFDGLQFTSSAVQALVQPLRMLTSLMSLQMLKIASISQCLDSAAEACVYTYLTARDTVQEINQALLLAVEKAEPSGASPAVFAWAIITDAWRGLADFLNAADDTSFPSGLDSNNTKNLLESFEEMRNPLFDVDLIQLFANSATTNLQVHTVIHSLAINLSKGFSTRIDHSFKLLARNALLQLITSSLNLVQYSEPVIQSTLSILNGKDGFYDIVSPPFDATTGVFTPSEALLNDTWATSKLLVQAQSRYPLETGPLLQLCQAFSRDGTLDQDDWPSALYFVRDLPRYTQRLPHGTEPYSLVREEENQNFASLDRDLPMFGQLPGQQYFRRGEYSENQALVPLDAIFAEDFLTIPTGTLGRIIDDSSKPYIGCWDFSYSGLSHLGLLLSTFVASSKRIEYPTQSQISCVQATDIVGLIASALAVCVRNDNVEGAYAVLEASSDGLDRTEDITTVILTILDEAMQPTGREADLETMLDLTASCMHFAYVVTKLLPHRIWPFLSRSSLINLDGSGGGLVDSIPIEMSLGRHEVLLGTVHLFDALVENTVAGAIQRRIPGKQVTRFEDIKAGGGGTTERAIGRIVTRLTRIMTDIFQSASSWRFENVAEKLELDNIILRTFQKILTYVYGYDDTQEPSNKITGLLASAAKHLLDTFLVPSGNDLALEPLLQVLAAGITIPTTTLFSDTNKSWVTRTVSALKCVETLIKISVVLNMETPRLQLRLFEACPMLARLFVAQESFKKPTLELLETMILSAGRGVEEPPSLLGHLGPENAKCFLKVLSSLSKPLEDAALELQIWRFLSAVVSHRQQWFAIYLLTGNGGRGSAGKEKSEEGKSRGRPLLQHALDQLADLETFQNKERAIAMLDFVALAQDNWPWAVLDVRKHSKFISSLANILNSQQTSSFESSSDKRIRMCDENRQAARIADIFAMCLHEARQMGDMSLAKDLSSKLYYYRDHAISGADTAYNDSLHTNLVRNLQMKFSLKPEAFKRTALTAIPPQFGENYFYALEYADEVLGFDSSWASKKGFRTELQISNIMLSLVESHVMLLNSWKNLALELSQVLPDMPALQLHMAKVVKDCIYDKTKSRLPPHIKEGLLETRVDLAFTLTQRLVEAESREPDIQSLFSTVWTTLRDSSIDLETGLTGPDAYYYRSVLKILLLSLRPHLNTGRNQPSTTSSTSKQPDSLNLAPDLTSDFLAVLSDVICPSYRHLCTSLHSSDPNPTSLTSSIAIITSDLLILISLLQSLLALPAATALQPHLHARIAAAQLIRYATSLFSWAHQLAPPPTHDPLCGELAILTLVHLSALPLCAHQVAVDGVLPQLAAAAIFQPFTSPTSSSRHGNAGVGPFDTPPRLHAIWHRGVLPLCLNLLRHVGAPLAAEVAGFLTQCTPQLARASRAIANINTNTTKTHHANHKNHDTSGSSSQHRNAGRAAAEPMTLALASEVHSLALIELICARFRAAGPAAGVRADAIPSLCGEAFPARAVREEAQALLAGNRALLRARLVPVGEREAGWLRREPVGGKEGGCENRLEERVVGELEGVVRCLTEVGEV
ncbi:MAG: hypothetical protein M1822_000241 [Bathelium mastoideum]|nr:MAG: hypothetical protein M1822_000241 [Bathelium mastoideum]